MSLQSFSSPQSSNVAGARYDTSTRTLEIDFHRSGTYVYHDFPKSRWENFRKATSKGTFLATHIKPKFKGIKKGGIEKMASIIDAHFSNLPPNEHKEKEKAFDLAVSRIGRR